MTFLPLVQREVCEAARRNSTYWTRFLAASAALALGTFIYMEDPPFAARMRGKSIFQGVSVLTFGLCLLSGIFFTSDCLSREKREGTLGLLFLTDLKGYDVGLGKLLATSLSALYGLVAIFPILAIPLLMGGVTWGDFSRTILVLANTMFVSLAIGMGISAVSRHERRAAVATFVALLLLTAGSPLLGETFRHLKGGAAPPDALLLPSPGFSLSLAFTFGFGQRSGLFWESVLTVHLIGWGVLLASFVLLPRVWQDRPLASKRFGWHRLVQYFCYGSPARRAWFRESRLRINPFFWLASRNRLRQLHLWGILAAILLAWIGGFVVVKNWRNFPFPMFAMILMHGLFKICAASEASHRLMEDRRSGALELLLSTPLSVREILRGQLHALHRQFAVPLVAVLFFDFVLLASLLSSRTFSRSDVGEISALFVTMMILMLLDFGALRWVGMWLAMRAKNSLLATLGAVVRVMLLPACLFFIAMSMAEGMRLRMQFEAVLGSWALLGLAISTFFWWRAKWQLTRRFRALASQTAQPRRHILRWPRFQRKPPRLRPPIMAARREVEGMSE
jgi:hypothetical protein